jgi:hypothetical protein
LGIRHPHRRADSDCRRDAHQFLSAIADGLEDADWSAVGEIAARNAGLT